MSNFPNIEKLGLKVFGMDVIKAEDLESLLQSAPVVYGPDKRYWNDMKEAGDNYSAILLAITPLKKKTKAEAALELLERLESMSGIFNVAWPKDDMKRILEMKDEV